MVNLAFSSSIILVKVSKQLRIAATFLALLLCIPAVYILSSGPLVFICQAFDPAGTSFITAAVENAYQPIVPFVLNSPSLGGKALRKYINLWSEEDLGEPPNNKPKFK
jgi:hypothetical protein